MTILQFPGKKRVPVGRRESTTSYIAPPTNVEEIPPSAQLQITQISDTAAVQIVKALAFYANQGYDGGQKARMALLGMQTVVESIH